MKILLAEYALAIALGGTYELEGRAMLSALAGSFERCGHEVVYPTHGPKVPAGRAIPFKGGEEGFYEFLGSQDADAGLVIAPDDLLAHCNSILESRMANLGSDPATCSIAADKLLCTRRLEEAGVPVAEIAGPGPIGCRLYVIKPRFGCGSEGVRISSSPRAGDGSIATIFREGLSLSASFVSGKSFLPLTINRQLIESNGRTFAYNGSQVPYRTPRAGEIWEAAKRACAALGLRGYAGIDFVLGDLPRVVDVNARPTTSIIGIARVMKEELADLILKASFGELPAEIAIEGEWTFRKGDLGG